MKDFYKNIGGRKKNQKIFKRLLEIFISHVILSNEMKDLTNKTNKQKTERIKNMQKNKTYPTGISALPQTKELVNRISKATGKKNYAILAEAVNLWAKQNGYDSPAN